MTRLSVIVPTRERADTLHYALRTLIEQNYADCEFIVSDNASIDDTQAVVGRFADARLRYINTGKRVCMAENWEFALRHAHGEFITYLGDDDGFLPGALANAMHLIDAFGTEALVWDKVEYCWPDYPDENRRNWFSIRTTSGGLRKVNARRKLVQVMRFLDGYNRLPCLYNGIVRKSLLDKVAVRSTNGLFFNAVSPDVHSGIVLANVIDDYIHSSYPFSVNGASRHSNGTSIVRPQQGEEGSPAARFMAENWRVYDARLHRAPAAAYYVMGEYMLARQCLPDMALPEPHWPAYLRALLRNAAGAFDPQALLDSARYTARAMGIDVAIPEQIPTGGSKAPALGWQPESFDFCVPESMVGNIHDACWLVAGMLPPVPEACLTAPWRRFVANLARTAYAEAKTLYRSY